jgi:hypothetical protein
MRLTIFLIIAFASCSSPTSEKVKEDKKEPIKPVVVKVIEEEKGPKSVIKEQLSGFYDEEQETNIVNQVKVNDSISYAISQTNDGICNTSYIHILKGEESLNFIEISKQCDHDQSISFYTHMDYIKVEDTTFLITEYVEYVSKDSLDDMGEMQKDYYEYDLLKDTLIRKLSIFANGNTEIEIVKDFFNYKRPSFEKEDHEDDYQVVYLVVVDTGMDYFSLNAKMYGIKNTFNMKVDTMGRFFNKITKRLILPEDSEDEIYAGDYMPRRDASSALSIEYYGFYTPTANDNAFALVAGIYPKKKEAMKVESRLKKGYSSCFLIESKIFMGCMH